MSPQLPFGIRYSRAMNYIFLVLICVLFMMAATSGYTTRALAAGKERVGGGFFILLAILAGIWVVPFYLIYLLNTGLSARRQWARIVQIILSLLALRGMFPLGTIFYAGSLYFLLFDRRTKAAFVNSNSSPEPA